MRCRQGALERAVNTVNKVRSERKVHTERAVNTAAYTERAVDTQVHLSEEPRVLDPAKGTFDNMVHSLSVYSTEHSGYSPSAQWSKIHGVLDHESDSQHDNTQV